MDNERKDVNEAEVSADVDTEGAAAPGTPTGKVCKECGEPTIPKGSARRYCDNCRDARSARQGLEARQKAKDSKDKANYKYASEVTPTKVEALRLLQERGILNDHVLNFVYDIALVAAELNHLTANRFYFQEGLRKTLQSFKAGTPQVLESIPNEEVIAELLTRAELRALWDFGFWRQPDITFDQWLKDRFRLKTSAYEMAKLLGKEDFGPKHEEWTAWAPRWNPIGLRPGYTQREALAWLDQQASDSADGKHRYLLVASRNSMKSTWARIHALCLTLCCPDAAILAISETNKLTSQGMTEWKGYVEMPLYNPSLFHQYFGEITVPPDSGKALVYQNPLSHLSLPQASFSQTSMQAANTGSRFWALYADDPVSNENYTATEEQRAEGLRKFSAAVALGEPSAFVLNTQTPWVEGDLGDVLIKKNDDDPEHPLAVRIDPVMEIKPEARSKSLLDLRAEDVSLNFLPKLNWRFVRDKIRDPQGVNWFKTQYLCQWIKEDEGLKVQFEHDEIWRRVKSMSYFGEPAHVQNILAVDRSGGSVARTADYNSAVVGRVQVVDGKQALCIIAAKMARLRDSELIEEILIPLISKHHVQVVAFEEDRHWSDFETNLRRELVRHNVPVPFIRHIPIDTTANSKAKAAKRLEGPLNSGRLYFNAGIPDLEAMLLQLERFDGRRSTSARKDDFVDSLQLLASQTMILTHREDVKPEEIAARREREAEEYKKAALLAHHGRMFSDFVPNQPTTRTQFEQQQRGYTPPPAAPEPPPAPVYRPRGPMGGGWARLPGSMRGGPKKP